MKAVLWGRSVFSNIRKFLMFQLTVNFVALVVAFVAAVGDGQTPLNVLQLLWVNLIMDSLGALGAVIATGRFIQQHAGSHGISVADSHAACVLAIDLTVRVVCSACN